MMRTYGDIAGISFKRQGFDIYNLATKYTLSDGYSTKTVFVNYMSELKAEITKYRGDIRNE